MTTRAVRARNIFAMRPVAFAVKGRFAWELPEGSSLPSNQIPAISGPVTLGSVDVGVGLVVATSDLLAGASDLDGDTLSVTNLSVTSGNATLSGDGPYTVTPTAAGTVSLSYTISDGNGGAVAQTAYIEAIAVVTYTRKDDYLGLFRNRFAGVNSYYALPPAPTYTGGTDTMVWEIGALIYSDEPYAAGTVEASLLTRGTASSTRDALIKNVDGSVALRSTNNITLTIGPAGTWALNEIVKFRITDSSTGILLEKMDTFGVYQTVQLTPRSTFTTYLPDRLFGSARSVHGSVLYFSSTKNGVVQYDFRLDEMTGTTIYSAHNPAVTGTYVSSTGPVVWKDETPESVLPQPDITFSGTLAQGNTLTFSSGTVIFPGGIPATRLFDDMASKTTGAAVDNAATIGSYNYTNTATSATYKQGADGKKYVVDYDATTGERLSRGLNIPVGFTEAFVSKTFMVPAGKTWPGAAANFPGGTADHGEIPSESTWKSDWLLTEDDSGAVGSDIVLGTHDSSDFFQYKGNSQADSGGTVRLNTEFQFNAWNTDQRYIKYNPTTPEASTGTVRFTSGRIGTVNRNYLGRVLEGGAAFKYWLAGAWIRQVGTTAEIRRTDIYAAFGPNAPCRVVIGNSAKLENCTAVAVCPPLTWSSGTVTARCNLGLLPTSQTLYAFIIGPDDQLINTTGKKLN